MEVPGTKKKLNKKTILIAGAGGAVAIGIWYYYKKKNGTAPATTDTTGQTGIDPNTGLPYGSDTSGIDPNTGVPYADEYGSLGGLGSGFGGWPVPVTDGGTGTGTGTSTITDNASWAADVTSKLTSQGYNASSVELAIGKYFLGLPMTDDEIKIIETAIGIDGQPPGGAPPVKRSGGGGGGGQGGGTVVVPNVRGKLYPAAATIITAHGLKPRRAGKTLGKITHETPAAGSHVKRGSTVTLSSFK